uniref:D-isomer specific 2-hydroxyacid dehydrogenase NAD-binding domain-containing protein n=1 Tax=Kalanchoe fedtschenkoi TaxID=63787 RepID=A0A7N0UQP1_KALFE
MADLQSDQLGQAGGRLPQVLIIKQPIALDGYLPDLSKRFDLLKAYESPLPIDDFLATFGKTVKAMICTRGTRVDRELVSKLPSLELIVTTSAGLNLIDLSECCRRRIAVANTGEIFSADCADLAVGLLIDVLRKVTSGDRFVRAGAWPSKGAFPLGSKLGGKRVGIVGLGSIGIQVAKRIGAFGCSISYNSRKPKASVPYPFYSNVCELAANCDALIICCALTAQTRHMVNREVLLALGKDGVVVNIARGAIIDEKALVRCLVEGEIRGAGLDVFENEPNVPAELLSLD